MSQDEERWRALAAEARAAAADLNDPQIQRTMLFIAAAYERLARHAAARSKTVKCDILWPIVASLVTSFGQFSGVQ